MIGVAARAPLSMAMKLRASLGLVMKVGHM